MSWQRIDLTEPEYAKPSEPPSTCELVYRGKRHLLSGPPEAAKTLTAFVFALEEIRSGGTVAIIDFESGAPETRRLLEDLGATLEEIATVHYFEPDGPPDDSDVASLVDNGVTLAIIDALAGAYDVSDLDDEKRRQVERFARTWIRPLWRDGIATIAIDHVVKNNKNRGTFSIGSERKLGAVDVHLGLRAIRQLHRGATGLIRVTTHKDRPAHLARPHAADIELHSDPATHRITWEIRPTADPGDDPAGGWRPTVLMERVSRYLEQQTDTVPVTVIYRDVRGKRDYLVEAVAFLVGDGYADEAPGNRRSRQIRSVKPYRDPSPTSPHPSPDAASPTVPHVPPSYGGDGNGSVSADETTEARWLALIADEPESDDLGAIA